MDTFTRDSLYKEEIHMVSLLMVTIVHYQEVALSFGYSRKRTLHFFTMFTLITIPNWNESYLDLTREETYIGELTSH